MVLVNFLTALSWLFLIFSFLGFFYGLYATISYKESLERKMDLMHGRYKSWRVLITTSFVSFIISLAFLISYYLM